MAVDNTTVVQNAEEVMDNPVYDESYTAASLKAAAKERGIAGYSTMTKAQLLEVLNNGN